MKRFIDPSYTLPDGWYASKLIELAEIHNNRRKPINSLERVNMKGPFPYCGANNVVDYINKYEFDGEYLLIAEDGGYWGKNEPTSYIMRGKFWVNNHAHIVKAKEGKTTNQFLCYILNYLNLDPIIGGDARGKLTKAVLTELLIPHPDFPEQRKIAYVLSTVQKAIEQQDKLIRTTTELKKALMKKLFTEGTKGEKLKQTEIGWLPESWEVVKIGEVIENWYGGGTPSTKIEEYWKGSNPWITSKWLSDKLELVNGEKFISDDGIKNSATSIVPANSLIFATRVGVGKVGINKINLSINQDLVGGQVKSKYDIYFIAYQFQLEKIQLEIERFKRGATIKGITRDNLKSIQLAFPKSLKEQKEISDIIKIMNSKIENHKKKKQTLTDLFKTLLHELMTGQRRVHELEFEGLNKEYKMEEQPLSMAAEK